MEKPKINRENEKEKRNKFLNSYFRDIEENKKGYSYITAEELFDDVKIFEKLTIGNFFYIVLPEYQGKLESKIYFKIEEKTKIDVNSEKLYIIMNIYN